jgi:SAM-dependent methyltransferase
VSQSLHKELGALQDAIAEFPEWDLADSTRRGSEHEGIWAVLDARFEKKLEGRRVLTVGCNTSRYATDFAARDADHVLACELAPATAQVQTLELRRSARIEFTNLSWDRLSPERQGTFDILHCHDLLHRVLDPMTLLRTLCGLTAVNGVLCIQSMVLADHERSECLRFMPAGHAGDPSWRFIPGRLAFRWMVEAVGFRVEAEFGEREGPFEGFPVVSGYLLAICP